MYREVRAKYLRPMNSRITQLEDLLGPVTRVMKREHGWGVGCTRLTPVLHLIAIIAPEIFVEALGWGFQVEVVGLGAQDSPEGKVQTGRSGLNEGSGCTSLGPRTF